MIKRTMEKQRRGEGGFTLIELLVVIVILGILAAIVVFAIGGLSDSAKTTSCTADRKTLETAEDAYYAAPGATGDPHSAYVDEGTLVTAKLLKTGGSSKYDAHRHWRRDRLLGCRGRTAPAAPRSPVRDRLNRAHAWMRGPVRRAPRSRAGNDPVERVSLGWTGRAARRG